MEYLPQGDLGAYLRQEPLLPESEAEQIISQTLRGLAIMHREKYAHRDVKPENILIHQRPIPGGPQSWWVKLTDFGLTKIMTRADVSATTAVGTPGYLAPELLLNQAAGQATECLLDMDHYATDVWALGATAFHILAGNLPFPGYFDMFQYVQNPEAQFPRAKLDRRLVSQEGRDFVQSLLNPKPEQRPDLGTTGSHVWLISHAQTAAAPPREYVSIPSRSC